VKERYRRRISGPILDRFDLHIEVAALRSGDFLGLPQGEGSAAVRERVERAREMQRKRYARLAGIHCNAQLAGRALRGLVQASEGAWSLLGRCIDDKQLSARAHDRILKLARTIADLQGDERVAEVHVREAFQLRCLDRPLEAGLGRFSSLPLQIARKAALHRSPGAPPGDVIPREGT
jgi:magnesium chelatase family protein